MGIKTGRREIRGILAEYSINTFVAIFCITNSTASGINVGDFRITSKNKRCPKMNYAVEVIHIYDERLSA